MQKITQAVILAGGKGQRLQPFTLNNPKPLIPINRKPFINHLIQLLEDNGIKEIIILTGYLADKMEKYIGKGSRYKAKIKLSYTPLLNEKGEENESGIRLKNAEKMLNGIFLLLYCDNYWPLNLKKLTGYFQEHSSDALVTIYSNQDRSTKNNVSINQSGFISRYDPTHKGKNLNGVDIGFFIVNKKVLRLLPKSNSKFESVVLPELIRKRKVSGFLTHQKYYSIGDLARVKTTGKFLSPKKVVFLDRDGVINKKPLKADYVKSWEEFKFLPNSIKAIKRLTDKKYQIFLITNQSGIARKALSEYNLKNIHKKMQQTLQKAGGKIDGIYYCPHNWDEGCSCRKPKPGLLYQASYDHFIDLSKAIFIGDDIRDKQAGDAAGCTTILVNKRKNLLQIVNSLN